MIIDSDGESETVRQVVRQAVRQASREGSSGHSVVGATQNTQQKYRYVRMVAVTRKKIFCNFRTHST